MKQKQKPKIKSTEAIREFELKFKNQMVPASEITKLVKKLKSENRVLDGGTF